MATLFRTGTRHCEMLCTATIGGGGQGDDLAWSEQVEVAWYASLGGLIILFMPLFGVKATSAKST